MLDKCTEEIAGSNPVVRALMKNKVFIKKSKEYLKQLKKYITLDFGKKCGHIGRDEISLDCIVCKSWLTYEFLSWFIDTVEDLEKS